MQSSICGDIHGKWQSPAHVPAVAPVLGESQGDALVHRASQTTHESFACGAVLPAEDTGHPHTSSPQEQEVFSLANAQLRPQELCLQGWQGPSPPGHSLGAPEGSWCVLCPWGEHPTARLCSSQPTPSSGVLSHPQQAQGPPFWGILLRAIVPHPRAGSLRVPSAHPRLGEGGIGRAPRSPLGCAKKKKTSRGAKLWRGQRRSKARSRAGRALSLARLSLGRKAPVFPTLSDTF